MKQHPKTSPHVKNETSRIASAFLKHIKIDAFGAFSNKVIGPFTPGLNVVYGKNEAGKTTLASFVGGVFFGWEEARGKRNTYKPHNADRSGVLFFETLDTAETFEFRRVRNIDGLQGPTHFIEDIDKETFSTMFSLSSDELRSLKNTSDITAKLLTAGSGTYASPTQALSEIQTRINEYTSRASGIVHSFIHLSEQQDETRQLIASASAEEERYKNVNKEFYELEPERKILADKLESLNSEIEALSGYKASLERLELQYEKILERHEDLLFQEHELEEQNRIYEENLRPNIPHIDSMEEFAFREHIDLLFEEQDKLKHRHARAKDTFTESKTFFEALLEADNNQELAQKTRKQRRTQIVLSIMLPFVFLLAGIPIFIHGREVNSLSFTAIGVCLILFAVLLAGAAMVMLFRSNKSDDELLQKRKDAQWIMLQDKKRLESCEADLVEHRKKVVNYLHGIGLDDAQGSLRRARMILDEAKEDRSQKTLFSQQHQALISQLTSIKESMNDIQEQKQMLATKLPEQTELSINAIEKLIEQKTQQRTTVSHTSMSIDRRYGEIKQALSHAQHLTRLNELLLYEQQLNTRQQYYAEDYARLLLAKRMLETAISAWESKSQPEVYKQASLLFEHMTNGTWEQIRMSPEGHLQVLNSLKTIREPHHLSLGTCQQLYLSLRIALLMTAENVGRLVPIMTDDILVNFDEDRRNKAIDALSELAKKRQVIIFTCHKEIVSLVQSSDSCANIVQL